MVMVDPVEMRNKVERFAVVALIGPPVHADRTHVSDDVVAESRDDESLLAAAVLHIQGERVIWVPLIGRFVNGAGLAPDDLTGRDERLAWRLGSLEVNAVFFIRSCGEHECVDLIAKLDGELEQEAAVLDVYFFPTGPLGGNRSKMASEAVLLGKCALGGEWREEMQAAVWYTVGKDLGSARGGGS